MVVVVDELVVVDGGTRHVTVVDVVVPTGQTGAMTRKVSAR